MKINALDHSGDFSAYVATPVGTPTAAIIVIQEIFGVNHGIRLKCDEYAAAGYLAIAPDLFWRLKPGIELDADVEADLTQAFGYFGQFDVDKGIADIEATIKAAQVAVNGGKIGIVGYCLGGKLAYLVACRTDSDASVGYYGVMIDQMLGESHAIANPLMLHIPVEDHLVSAQAQAAIHAGLDGHAKVTLYDYPGLDHGFAAQSGNRRNDVGAALADERTAAFFAVHLT